MFRKPGMRRKGVSRPPPPRRPEEGGESCICQLGEHIPRRDDQMCTDSQRPDVNIHKNRCCSADTRCCRITVFS